MPFRRTRGRLCGALRRTNPKAGWLFTAKNELHRTARVEPTFMNTKLLLCIGAFGMILNLTFYFGNRFQQWLRGSTDIALAIQLDEIIFSRPDLAVALVKMNLHYVFSNTATPYGAPMVAPLSLQPEAEELSNFVREMNKAHPHKSIPDIWAMMTRKASLRIGGPEVCIKIGRTWPKYDRQRIADQNSGTSGDSNGGENAQSLVQIVDSVVSDRTRDVSRLKQVGAAQGLSVEEIVSAVGAYRNIGFHGDAGIHSTAQVRPTREQMYLLQTDALTPSPDTLVTPQSNRKCSVDPYTFDGLYFNHLLDYKWQPAALDVASGDHVKEASMTAPWWRFLTRRASTEDLRGHEQAMTIYKCDENIRRRSRQILIDPFSRENARLSTEVRETPEGGKAFFKDEIPIEAQEAQTQVDFCGNIMMEPIDLALMDDAMCVGWVAKLAEDEPRFFATVGRLMAKIQDRGYNKNLLKLQSTGSSADS